MAGLVNIRNRKRGKDCMKRTGISRRIDETGRIVIPGEIRKTLGLKAGDPVEIFTHDNEIVLRKYDVLPGLAGLVKRLDDEFSGAGRCMDSETAGKIREHINALQDLLAGMEEGDDGKGITNII